MAGTVEGWKPKTQQSQEDILRVTATVHWAKLNKPNDQGKYQVDLGNLSDTAVQKLKDRGVSVKAETKEYERGNYITCVSKQEIFAFDTENNRIHEGIGNGSKADVVLSFYEWPAPYSGSSASIRRLTITELIPFESSDLDLESLPEAI